MYFAKTKYGYDSKNNATFFTGVDFNAYYTIFKNKTFRESIGAGYAFRFMNYSYDNYTTNKNSNGATINLLIEGKVSEHFGIGFKAAWQPFGTYNSLIYGGLYGTVKF